MERLVHHPTLRGDTFSVLLGQTRRVYKTRLRVKSVANVPEQISALGGLTPQIPRPASLHSTVHRPFMLDYWPRSSLEVSPRSDGE